MSNEMKDIYLAILAAVESKLHLIGSVLDADARKEVLAQKIYDKGDFYNAMSYILKRDSDTFTLTLGSNVKHEPFVLGGKVPSWTPIAPLKAWVERKNLSWVDKVSGKMLSIEQIAYMIRGKIKREGIPERNVYKTIIDNRQQWIFDQLNSIEVVL